MSDFNSYQRSAKGTAIYPDKYKILYPALGLAGEAGEVANKVKKIVRDGPENMPEDWREQLASELGDVIWYCAALASDLNISLGQVAGQNLEKLARRQQANTLSGSGDNR
jgi:NTP pyrophosphatase (non-canonical NTP hydrolase)